METYIYVLLSLLNSENLVLLVYFYGKRHFYTSDSKKCYV
jgi:hypothetical protein